MPITGTKLVIEPRHPFQLDGARMPSEDDAQRESRNMLDVGERFDFSNGSIFPINAWWSKAKQAEVWVYHTGDGRSRVGLMPRRSAERLHMSLLCMGMYCEGAWSMTAEIEAMKTLRHHVGDYKFSQYLLTGGFLESSPRSNVMYWFRRLRPTVAFTHDADEVRPLCTLCLHPIGYYDGSFAGVMVPTDDVIAHLLLMRGDEHSFWKQANQHSVTSEASGL